MMLWGLSGLVPVSLPYLELQLAGEDRNCYREFLARERSFEGWRERWCPEHDSTDARAAQPVLQS